MTRETSLAVVLLILLCNHARAVMIPIDPGPVDETIYHLTASVPELVGPAEPGEFLSVTINYTDMKHLEVTNLSGSPLFFTLRLQTDVTPTLRNVTIQDGFLTDEFNSPLTVPPSSLYTEVGGLSASYFLSFDSPYQSIHHGVRWDITLPNVPSFSEITSAEFEIRSLDLVIAPASITVGEWTAVPELSTFALLLVAAPGMLVFAWRRQRRHRQIRSTQEI